MEIAVTGASGFIGRRVTERLRAAGHNVTGVSLRGGAVSLPRAEAVVHLAGEPIAQRWTSDARRRIRESRVDGTHRLVDAMRKLPQAPSALVSASAVGIYGSRGDEILTENSPPASGFLAEACKDWEAAADSAAALGARVVKLRMGVVLGRGGGALARMLPPFKAGAGGRVGSGRQWMSWIHIDDAAELFRFAVETPALRGIVNATAPNPVPNAVLTRALASVLRRPAIVPVPAFALKLIFGEMATVLLDSQRVIPQAAQAAGFRFRYPEIRAAFEEILGSW
jgi:uncharacterized protein (TIGR01777 family)